MPVVPVPSDLARREYPDLIPIHNSQLCGCPECRETGATIAAWHVQGLLQMHSAYVEPDLDDAIGEFLGRQQRAGTVRSAAEGRLREHVDQVRSSTTVIKTPPGYQGLTARQVLQGPDDPPPYYTEDRIRDGAPGTSAGTRLKVRSQSLAYFENFVNRSAEVVGEMAAAWDGKTVRRLDVGPGGIECRLHGHRTAEAALTCPGSWQQAVDGPLAAVPRTDGSTVVIGVLADGWGGDPVGDPVGLLIDLLCSHERPIGEGWRVSTKTFTTRHEQRAGYGCRRGGEGCSDTCSPECGCRCHGDVPGTGRFRVGNAHISPQAGIIRAKAEAGIDVLVYGDRWHYELTDEQRRWWFDFWALRRSNSRPRAPAAALAA